MGDGDNDFSKYRRMILSELKHLEDQGDKLERSVDRIWDAVSTISSSVNRIEGLVAPLVADQARTSEKVGTLENTEAYSKGKMAAIGVGGSVGLFTLFEFVKNLLGM